MIIRHMQGTFGTLDGEQLRLDTGLNIIYAPNESGKSTWCAFLRAMLYGIDTSQRARAGFVPDKQKYAPWSGKPMAGELELEQGGKCITIRRWTEAPNAPLRGFSAVYTGTDIPVPGLTAADAGGGCAKSFCCAAAAFCSALRNNALKMPFSRVFCSVSRHLLTRGIIFIFLYMIKSYN